VALVSWPASAHRSAAAGEPAAPPGSTQPAAVLGRSSPIRLQIPAIGVDTALLTLGLRADGTLEVPPLDAAEAGWYEHSPTPGELGPAILLGHVDSARTGPGVFHDLPALVPGDRITVGRADGGSVAFAVDRVERYPKAAFPTAEVYGDIDHAGLRLITCGGVFDREAGRYLDNVVVYARAVTP
jgi:sortase (surface protein transpeptidase)